MNKKISELEEADSIKDEDLIMIVQKNKNMKIPYKKMQQIDTKSLIITKNTTTDGVITATTLTNNYTITLPLQYQVRQ